MLAFGEEIDAVGDAGDADDESKSCVLRSNVMSAGNIVSRSACNPEIAYSAKKRSFGISTGRCGRHGPLSLQM